MLALADIEDELKELESQFRRDQRAREQQYTRDRQALENAREVIARRLAGRNGLNGKHSQETLEQPRLFQSDTSQPTAAGLDADKPKDRDLVRAIALKMPPEFTMRDMIKAKEQDPDERIRALSDGTIHATMHWFKKHHLVEVVRERENQSKANVAVYRIVSKDLRRPAIAAKRHLEFPLKEMVLKAAQALSPSTFEKQSVFEKVSEMFSEHASRIKADSVSATLNKLAVGGKIRLVSKGSGGHGNVYEYFQPQPLERSSSV